MARTTAEVVTVDRILLLHPELHDLDMTYPAGLCNSCGAPYQPRHGLVGEDGWDQYPAWVSFRHFRGHMPPVDSTGLVVVPVDEVVLVTLCPLRCAPQAQSDVEWSCVPFELKVAGDG